MECKLIFRGVYRLSGTWIVENHHRTLKRMAARRGEESPLETELTVPDLPPPSCRSPLQPEHVWPSGLLCRWPNGLELTARQAPRPIAIDWQFPVASL